ncbi:MAG: polysaccharide deacetylase family protein [Candidatus Omnitrophica bacterium]|nr:polysaccharide deacetylase family protein [Candidatus Omnitrophota bacterium]
MFKRIRLIVSACLIIVFVVSIGYLRSIRTVTVITYHSIAAIADEDDRLTVLPKSFNRQMQFLKDHKYNVISLERLGELIKSKKAPDKTIAITFDDGFKDNYLYAYPVLKRLNFPATIFIIVDKVGSSGKRLTWEEIKEMQGSGLITFGSHTLSHPYLTEINSEAELKRQIFDSKKILEQKLGVPVDVFCYPSGRFNAHIKDLVVQAGYKFAVGTTLGKRFSNFDPYLIKRVRISASSDNLIDFWARVSGYYNSFRKHSRTN